LATRLYSFLATLCASTSLFAFNSSCL
jgi:hypothetical protein